MSALSSLDSSMLSNGLPPIDPAREPADIRNGSPAAKKAYTEALGFEDILVQQLSQELASTVSGSTDSSGSSDSSDDGSGDDSSGDDSSSGGILGSDPGTSAFASMIPQALTTSIMSDGGLGIAAQLAQALDPSIGSSSSSSGSSSSSSGSSSTSTNSSSPSGGSSIGEAK